jgi:hypothetical protein
VNEIATEVVHLWWVGYRWYALKAPAGALGGNYGDFFPQVGGQDVGFVRIRYFGTFSPIYFSILILFLLFLFSFFYFNCLLVLL